MCYCVVGDGQNQTSSERVDGLTVSDGARATPTERTRSSCTRTRAQFSPSGGRVGGAPCGTLMPCCGMYGIPGIMPRICGGTPMPICGMYIIWPCICG
mmetsp:Transcript_106/g.436  ORF Transcript_106/g.436 Transcript_106/m.436 type:complete len:98 (-) Transcript_106:1094-1387(-)